MVNHGERQPREPKVLRVRVVVPTAAVATFSTLTLAGVAALGFASGSLDGEVPTRNADWAVNSPGSVSVLVPDTSAAGATPQSAPVESMDAAAGRDDAALDANVAPAAPRAGSVVAPANQARQVSPRVVTGTGARAGVAPSASPSATPVKNRPTISHRAPQEKATASDKARSNMLQITLPARVLLGARQSVAEGLTLGLMRELDAQDTESLQAELKSSTKLDDAVAKATGDAAQQGILAGQAAAGPKAAPSVVSQVAEQTFRAELPRQLTMTVQPVVLNVLGDLSSEVSAAALSSALDTAATGAAAQVCDQVAEHVGDQVAVLVETTRGDGVAAPTATVTTDPVPDPPAPTSSTTPDDIDKNTGPSRSTTTEPTSDPATETGRGPEPTQTTADPGTDRGTEPTSETSSDSRTSTDPATEDDSATSTRTGTETAPDADTSRGIESASEPSNIGRVAQNASDPTSPTSVSTSATSITVSVTQTGASDR